MNFGEKITHLRKENNMTQEQLSEILGVSRQSISRWESGIAFPETEKLLQLSKLFNCTLDYLFKDDVSDKNANTVETKETIIYKKQNKLNNALNIVFSILILSLIILCVGLMIENSKLNSESNELIEQIKESLRDEEFYFELLNQSENKLQFEKTVSNKINGYQIDYVCTNVSIKIYEEFKLYSLSKNIMVTELDDEGFVYLNNGYFKSNVEGLYNFYIKLEYDEVNNVFNLDVSTERIGSAYRYVYMYIIRDGIEHKKEMRLYDEFYVFKNGVGDVVYNFAWVTKEANIIRNGDVVYFELDYQKFVPQLGYYFDDKEVNFSKIENGIVNDSDDISSAFWVLVVRDGKIYIEHRSIWESK